MENNVNKNENQAQGQDITPETKTENKKEKVSFKDKASKALDHEIKFTPRKVVTTILKVAAGAAAVVGIAGYAYNKGQTDALEVANADAPELPGPVPDTDVAFDEPVAEFTETSF